jgi:antitoxin component YwqK of YwqJK toxin-antitoxin module
MINIKRLFFIFVFFACFFTSKELNAQKINQFDENNKRTGLWKKHYPNKKIRYQGIFKNGKEVGVFKFYDIRSSEFPVSIKTYTEKKDTVAVKFYSIKGRLQSKGKMLFRKREGKWSYYFANGNILAQENYTNGKLNGTVLNYYPQGNLAEQTDYKNGLKHGVSKKYSNKNVLMVEVHYKEGKLTGEVVSNE